MNRLQSELVKDASEAHGLSPDAHSKHRRLKEVQQELDQMRLGFAAIANTFHEVRTPLHSMSGFIKLMLEGKVSDPETQREFLTTVDQRNQDLRKLAAGILELAATESGQVVFEKRPVSMKGVIDNAAVKLQGFAEEKGIAIETTLPRALPDVEGAFDKLEQVVTNLLSFAIRFSRGEGRVFVTAKAVSNGVLVEIVGQSTDTLADAIPCSLQKTSELDIPMTPDDGGAWLDLYLARQIVQAHGGELWLENEPGNGTTLSFVIPESPHYVGKRPQRQYATTEGSRARVEEITRSVKKTGGER